MATTSAAPSSANTAPVQQRLDKEQELRLEIDDKSEVKVVLKEGTAEVFGSELALNIEYTLTDCNIPIFTWQGCVLELQGPCKHKYVSDGTPMRSYVNLHWALQNRREKQGPRVVIVGPVDAGKSSLSKLLLNYSVRCQNYPLFVDLDVGQGQIVLPGAVAAVQVDKTIDLQNGFGLLTPLVYYFGHTSPGENMKLYKLICSRLAQLVNQRLEQSAEARSAGFIVNTGGWIEGQGFELLVQIIQMFAADIILVIGQERLAADLEAHLPSIKHSASVIKVVKSVGVVVRDSRYRRQARSRMIRNYFYGPRGNFCPHHISVSFSDVELYQLGQEHIAPSSALPIGEKRILDETRCTKILPSRDLVKNILAVSHAADASDKALLESNIAGFVCVEEVDMNNKQLRLLSPTPGRLPFRYLLSANIWWREE